MHERVLSRFERAIPRSERVLFRSERASSLGLEDLFEF